MQRRLRVVVICTGRSSKTRALANKLVDKCAKILVNGSDDSANFVRALDAHKYRKFVVVNSVHEDNVITVFGSNAFVKYGPKERDSVLVCRKWGSKIIFLGSYPALEKLARDVGQNILVLR